MSAGGTEVPAQYQATVGEVIDWLSAFPSEAKVYVYEGECQAIVVEYLHGRPSGAESPHMGYMEVVHGGVQSKWKTKCGPYESPKRHSQQPAKEDDE